MNDIKIFKLKNGATVIHQRAKNPLAHVRVYFKVGSISESTEQKGVAHLTEHLMFKGTKTRTTQEISKLLEIKGAAVNAATGYEDTCYYASVRPEFIETILDLFSDMIINKHISTEEFEKEKSVVIQELKWAQDEYDFCNLDNLYKQVYGLDPIVGFEKTLKKITLDDVYAFMKRHYTAGNMTLSLVSDKTHTNMRSLLDKYFGEIETGSKNIYKPLEVKQNQVVIRRKKINQIYIMHSYTLADFNDIKEYTKATALSDILYGEAISSVLHREIRDKHGLAYQIYADISSFEDPALSRNAGVCINIIASMEKKNLKKYLDVLPKMIKGLPAAITEEDMERIKNQRASREYITAKSRAESNYFVYTRYGKTIPYEYRDKIYYDITLNKIKSFINKYLKAENVSYAIYGPINSKK